MKHIKPLDKNNKLHKKLHQINWYTEIDTNEIDYNDKEAVVELFSDYLSVYSLLLQHFESAPDKFDDESKSNTMRVLHYLSGKSSLFHSLFYGKDLNSDEYTEGNTLGELEKNYNIKKSTIPLENVKHTVDALFKINQARKDAKKVKDGGIDEVNTKLEEKGLKTVAAKGLGKEGNRDTACIMHDGIPYHISFMKRDGERSDETFDEKVSEHHKNIKKYHKIVKPLFYRIKELANAENLWVMEGGGSQVQMFFGDERGYIGILYLGMRTSKTSAIFRKDYTLQINGSKNDKYFKDIEYIIPNIKVKTSESVWGKDEDDD